VNGLILSTFFVMPFPRQAIIATEAMRRSKPAMSSETERITNEVMDRHDFVGLAEPESAEYRQLKEGSRHASIDPHFINKGYMELEQPSRGTTH
jgi:ABC-type hemin transport system ATPase subunit